MSQNQLSEKEVVNQIQENFDKAQQEFAAMLAKIEEDPQVLLDPAHQKRLAELNELVTATYQRAQEAAAQFHWEATTR